MSKDDACTSAVNLILATTTMIARPVDTKRRARLFVDCLKHIRDRASRSAIVLEESDGLDTASQELGGAAQPEVFDIEEYDGVKSNCRAFPLVFLPVQPKYQMYFFPVWC